MTTPGALPPPSGAFAVDNPNAPALNVVHYLNLDYLHQDRYTLMYHRESFWSWTGTFWKKLSADTLASDVYKTFEDAVWLNPGRGQNPVASWDSYMINPAKLDALVKGLKNKVLIDDAIDVPVWMDGENPVEIEVAQGEKVNPADIIACKNGLVHAPTRMFWAHTPRFLNTVAVDYDYNPSFGTPKRWQQFLHEVWPDDTESIETLQEIFGYLLTTKTNFQTMFMFIGQPRSGKGTVVRTLTALLGGSQSVGSASLADLNQRFGLEDVETKSVAVMQDSRFSARDASQAIERLLSITGEDPVSIDKKGRGIYTAKLSTRFVLVSNDIPRMQDDAGALRARTLMLKFAESFTGREDRSLDEQLARELPGIFNWALDGLDRLVRRRRFVQPKAAEQFIDVMTSLASPVRTFIDDLCVTRPDVRVPTKDLYTVFRAWCEDTGNYKSADSVFGRNLMSAVGGIDKKRPLVDGKQVWHYYGIGLSEEAERILAMQRFGGYFG